MYHRRRGMLMWECLGVSRILIVEDMVWVDTMVHVVWVKHSLGFVSVSLI